MDFNPLPPTQAVTERVELIEELLAIGVALSSSRNLGELLDLILLKSREITCSDAGSVYLIDRPSDRPPNLVFKVAQNDSFPNLSLQEFVIPITPQSLAGYVALTGQSLNLRDAYRLPPDVLYHFDPSFDQTFGYRTRSVLVLPMQNQQRETIGVLQLINRKIAPEASIRLDTVLEVTQTYTDWEERIVRSLASQAAISIERNHLQESIESLFEGFIRASVQIIEARDPCTSGHSERVADLTVRLSEEVNSVTAGSLCPFYFSDRQIQEIRYAALLHDFGKVGVPETVLVKQKKLYPDQLDVIHHRFALARRGLELDCAQAKFRYLLEHPSHVHSGTEGTGCPHCDYYLAQQDQVVQQQIEQLNQCWELLLEANEPRLMPEEPLARLQELLSHTYQDVDGEIKSLLSPEELEQLLVRQGSLNLQERLMIQAHVTHTYEFLRQIPWTKHLQNVPLFASGHHEKLDGSGYPQGLSKLDIPMQTQMMTIADIYDALTAHDRPYKRAVPVEKALHILRQEAAKSKINHDLVLLFEQRQVFTIVGHTLGYD
jgi:HD-GYP domain-containing protein (c-di-GMP phosphodiesterase class II)